MQLGAKMLVFHIRMKNFFVHKFSNRVFPRCNFCNNMVVCCMQKQNDSAGNNAAILYSFQVSLICAAATSNVFVTIFFPAHSCKYIKSISAKAMTE